jgi:hypothetical protein
VLVAISAQTPGLGSILRTGPDQAAETVKSSRMPVMVKFDINDPNYIGNITAI